jgi:hypothetical protein
MIRSMGHIFPLLFATVMAAVPVTAQLSGVSGDPSFRAVVEKRLKGYSGTTLARVCPVDTDKVAERVFRDYGAMFLSKIGGGPPPKCVFESEAEVQAFQAGVNPSVATVGGVQVTLQRAAMTALLAARDEAAKKGLAITPRGGSEASTRSYQRTVELWRSRFLPALAYWTGRGKIRREDADRARRAPIRQQVEMVLAWEEKGYWFSTDMSKSILYSVAAPGASQHIFMLALDVSQFASRPVREILAKHGWFQTVKSDLPHFTYIGEAEKDLPRLGLTPVTVSGQTFWIPNI